MNNKLGEFIKTELKKRSWSISYLSKTANLSTTYINNLIKGKNNNNKSIYPSTDTICKLARSFNIPEETVFKIAIGKNKTKKYLLSYQESLELLYVLEGYCKASKFLSFIDLSDLDREEIQQLAQELLLSIPGILANYKNKR